MGGLAGAKALAASILDFLQRPALVRSARESFRREIGDVVYRPLLPDSQRPPAALNRAEMEKYRAQMEQHYVRGRPVFHA